MIDDLSKTIKAQLYERINSPLLGSFLLSWATWNYRFIVTLFSEMSVEKTFIYIDQTLYPTWLYASWILFIGPAITAAFLIFIYPYPAKFVYEYARNRQKELKEIQQKIDDETPLTRQEAREIRDIAQKRINELEEQTQKQNGIITRSQTELLAQTNKINSMPDLQAPVTTYPPVLTPSQNVILHMIVKNRSGITEDRLHSQIETDTLTRDFDVGELEAKGLIGSRMTEGDETLYYAHHEGRRALIHAQNLN